MCLFVTKLWGKSWGWEVSLGQTHVGIERFLSKTTEVHIYGVNMGNPGSTK